MEIENLWVSYTPKVPYLGACFISFLAGYPLAELLNIVDFRSERELKDREIRRFGTELEILAVNAVEAVGKRESIENAPMHMVTLRNGKVFIGFINAAPFWPTDTAYIRMVKLASGYRTSELDIEVVSRYDNLLRKDREEAKEELAHNWVEEAPRRPNYLDDSPSDIVKTLDRVEELPWDFVPTDFEVTIPLSEILHVAPFEKKVMHPHPDKELDWPLKRPPLTSTSPSDLNLPASTSSSN